MQDYSPTLTRNCIASGRELPSNENEERRRMCSHDVDLLDTEINWRPRLACSGFNAQPGDCGVVPAFEALTVRTRIAHLFNSGTAVQPSRRCYRSLKHTAASKTAPPSFVEGSYWSDKESSLWIPEFSMSASCAHGVKWIYVTHPMSSGGQVGDEGQRALGECTPTQRYINPSPPR